MNDLVNAMAAFINLRFVKKEVQSVILGRKQKIPRRVLKPRREKL